MANVRFNPSYTSGRKDLLALVPVWANCILDVGCSTGKLGESIKDSLGAEVVGIEVSKEMAEFARARIDRVIIGDVETLDLAEHVCESYFDCIIFGDVLEHLRNPWATLRRCLKYLSDDGIVISSLPNVRHYQTLLNLFLGYWPYRDRGIHDRTHLRFFTLRNIRELFEGANLEIVHISRNYRIIERPHPRNRYSKYLAFWPFKEFLTFQYLIVGKKRKKAAGKHD